MNLKSGRWRWVTLLFGNALLFSLACLAPVNVPHAVAVDIKPTKIASELVPPAVPVPVTPAVKKVDEPAAAEQPENSDDADLFPAIGQVVFRDELDRPPLPCAD